MRFKKYLDQNFYLQRHILLTGIVPQLMFKVPFDGIFHAILLFGGGIKKGGGEGWAKVKISLVSL